MTQPYPPQPGDAGPGREATQQFPVGHGQPGPPYGAPQHGVSQQRAPQYGARQQGVPQYGAPQYGGRGAPGPKKPDLLPWLIVTGVALVAALGVLVFLLFRNDDAGTTNAADRSAQPSAEQSEQQSDEGLGDTDGDAVVPPDEGPEEQGEIFPEDDGTGYGYDASLDRATAFMDDVILGDYASAISHGGQEFQAYYSDGVDLFAAEIAEGTDGGTLYNYSVDSITYDPKAEADVVDVSIEMEEGWMDEFHVLVGAEGGNLVIVGFG